MDARDGSVLSILQHAAGICMALPLAQTKRAMEDMIPLEDGQERTDWLKSLIELCDAAEDLVQAAEAAQHAAELRRYAVIGAEPDEEEEAEDAQAPARP